MLAVATKLKGQNNPIEVASFGENQPIGMAVSEKTNRIFVSFPHNEPFLYALTEIIDGKRVPYPNKEWNVYQSNQPEEHFVNVQDMMVDDRDMLWVLDSKPGGGNSVFGDSKQAGGQFKLVKIDLKDNQVKKTYTFDDLPKNKSALNDVRIDNNKQLAYLSDPALKAIVVLNLVNGKSRIVLQDDPATLAQPGYVLHIEGKDVMDASKQPFVSNVNGIALTRDNQYLYFRAINQDYLYRIETKYLADTSLDKQTRSSKVEKVAKTGVCHGMIADRKGNIYLTVSTEKAIKYLSPDGQIHLLSQSDQYIWPDSFGIGKDG
ncbi:L-dopachrome tautomerase-related protein [Olivibacter ginsenosidimutans]|uniref:L-dopachrome tautomerase-related protein n=2 Tax=Olivibacter ginsenosidimutans TaxID=1176537 RepID=A0ABP9CES8_9SPHI